MSLMSPSWEVIFLVSSHLDPKSLAISCLVSKQWFHCMNSDHLWKSLCSKTYPNLLHLKTMDSTLTYRRLYSLGLEAAKRSVQPLPPPRFAIEDLTFALSIQSGDKAITLGLYGSNTSSSSNNGLFRFEFNTSEMQEVISCKTIRVSLDVILKDWRAVFCMFQSQCNRLCDMDSGKVFEGWLTKELPKPGCCGGDTCRGAMADLILRFGGRDGIHRLERVNIGLMSTIAPRYLQVDDGLRYLENFLM